jgi:predicted nucleic acid-binding protein
VARGKSRAGAPPHKVDEALTASTELRIDWHVVAAAELHALAPEPALTTCDAACLSLAARLKAHLGTFDRRLSEAAQRHLGAME